MIKHMTTLTMWPIAPSPLCPISIFSINHDTHLPTFPIAHMSKKMSSCQKDVKLSKRCQVVKKMSSCQKRCQMSKSQTHRLWRRFTKKINSHNEVHTYWCQFWRQIWRSPKLFKNTFYVHFEGFWSPSYVTSKLTSVCVNLIMSIYFFLWTSSIVHVFDFLTTWHLFDNLTSFWQLDIFLTNWHLFWHMGNGKCGQMGIMVNTEDRDGAPWGMGHMGGGATWSMWSCAWSCATSLILHGSLQKFYWT